MPNVGYERKALLISREPLDAQNAAGVERFVVTGDEPAGTMVRVAFRLGADDTVYICNGGQFQAIGDADVDTVLGHGHTPAELNRFHEVGITDAFIGKKIYPIIALQADEETTASPTVKIALITHSSYPVYQKVVDSPAYQLASEAGAVPRIADISCKTATTGEGSVTVQVRLLDDNDVWSNYMPLTAAAQKEAVAVQFRLTYNVVNIGSDSAQVKSITIRHNMGATAVSGDVAELYSVVQDYQVPLQICYAVVRHKYLRDAEIRAYVNFMVPPNKRELIFIGTGIGTVSQFVLGVDGWRDLNRDQNTLKIFVNGEQISSFGYNIEVSEVTVNAPVGAAITASYDYNRGAEVWHEMSKLIDSQPYLDDENTYMTRFSFVLPDDDAVNTTQSNIRISLHRSSGAVVNQDFGVATGLVQQVILPHAARQETINFNADWSYDADSRVLTYVAPKHTPLVLSYDYLGDQQVIYSFAAGWAVA